MLNSNSEEADTRVWLHTFRSPGSKKLLYSPDTDVYHIGLVLLGRYPQSDVFIQLSAISSPEKKLLHLNSLCSSLSGDPDLAIIPSEIHPKVLQTLFVCTGCDYVSFFAGLGKATFLRNFFQHANFINANSNDLPGTLADTSLDRIQCGFLAFVRLIGTVYFKKHFAAFKFDSPRTYLNSFASKGVSINGQHKNWLEDIKATVWERVDFEDELPPSWEALWRHWLRTCWVSHYWSQATQNQYSILKITDYGWKLNGDTLEIDWDSKENMEQIRDRVHHLLRVWLQNRLQQQALLLCQSWKALWSGMLML